MPITARYGAQQQETEVPPTATVSAPPTATKPTALTAGEALRHSYRVGLSGAGATVFSVVTMMWLHTIVTYQQRHGTKFAETCKRLWRAGGPRRFYRGVMPSLAAAPLCRFGDTLSNELAMTWFHGQQSRRASFGAEGEGAEQRQPPLPVWIATFLGSAGAAAFHALVVPLDTYKVWRGRWFY